jgi:hypothetical protein
LIQASSGSSIDCDRSRSGPACGAIRYRHFIAVNPLTALLRTIDLGIDARRALTTTTIITVAPWRTRGDNATLAVCRAGATRLARRIRAFDANHAALHQAVAAQAPHLLDLGVDGEYGPPADRRLHPDLAKQVQPDALGHRPGLIAGREAAGTERRHAS